MNFFMVIPYYLSWHYSRGLAQWTRNLFNFITFEFSFFSVKDLLRNLFAPFQRLSEHHTGSPIEFGSILSVIVVNLIMRAVGLLVRSVILIFASVVITLSFVLATSFLVLWVVLPLFLLAVLLTAFFMFPNFQP